MYEIFPVKYGAKNWNSSVEKWNEPSLSKFPNIFLLGAAVYAFLLFQQLWKLLSGEGGRLASCRVREQLEAASCFFFWGGGRPPFRPQQVFGVPYFLPAFLQQSPPPPHPSPTCAVAEWPIFRPHNLSSSYGIRGQPFFVNSTETIYSAYCIYLKKLMDI
jgi:hypothetical protein